MSKKKIAVLIGGEYRYLDVAIESWKGIINYGCDFYVSTWDTTKPKDKYGILQNNIEITKNMITDLIPTAIVSLLDNTERELLHNISLHNTIKQLYHWKNLIKIIDDKEQVLNITKSISGLKKIIQNYHLACSSYYDQIKNGSTENLQEVENLRRKITREVADVGGLIMNRENLLNTAYTMDEIAGYITGIAFKLSNVKITTLKSSKLDKDIGELISLVVDEVYKLNEIIRSLNTNTANAIELAQETQTIEREIDIKYRDATIKLLNEVKDPKELLLIKDVIEGIEEMSDKCQRVSDSFILLALSL